MSKVNVNIGDVVFFEGSGEVVAIDTTTPIPVVHVLQRVKDKQGCEVDFHARVQLMQTNKLDNSEGRIIAEDGSC